MIKTNREPTRSRERLGIGMQTVVLNEHTPGNILSDPNRPVSLFVGYGVSDTSTEGFSGQPAKQAQLARFYIDSIGLRGRGDMLDVGFGSNRFIGGAFVERGIPSFGIDLYTARTNPLTTGDFWHTPRIEGVSQEGITLVSGDVSELGKPDSALQHNRFGTILFNGSWDAEGENFTVGGQELGRKRFVRGIAEPYYDYLDRERTTVLEAAQGHLEPNGVLGVVSSRFANHGGDYTFGQLPIEKLSFVDLYARFREMGAQKLYVVGLSQDGFDNMVQRSRDRLGPVYNLDGLQIYTEEEQQDIIHQLRSPINLDVPGQFRGAPEQERPTAHIARMQEAVSQAESDPAFSSVARIDALFAEFPSGPPPRPTPANPRPSNPRPLPPYPPGK